ncbi:MAG: ABC transporter ATP-binding protein/permease, partial [Clostridia bacterium]|nr:ABC transporter ATP-binding protein/permease [Clostridia bacterium]
LRGVSLDFRENEFVSILGPSGCGKTTLLNIIGGLDGYTTGDLIIGGKSTKDFTDSDWDAYRNHKIGFVFQSYNLIPHQTVLANVELALTLSGVSREERHRRAKEALESVGLGDQLYKKPSQMSGGQMQRVAIARALVNDPDILLADEPTGALDSETSVQVMEILKNISEKKLIIMVTHNPDIAEKYSTRIIRLLDGNVVSDSEPYSAEAQLPSSTKRDKTKSMSFFTAMNLSLNNLMTKKGRTFLTAFAGSIGIIGIALILSISNGITLYINDVEENTLSSYPIMIESQTVDMTSMMENFMGQKAAEVDRELDRVYSSDVMGDMLSAMMSEVTDNDLASFKKFIDDEVNGFLSLVSDIKYGYSTPLNVYTLADYGNGETLIQVEPNTVFDSAGMTQMSEMSSMMTSMGGSSGLKVWDELIDNDELLDNQYDVIAGRMPEEWNELVIIVNKNNEISDMALFALGLKDQSTLDGMMYDIMNGEFNQDEATSYSYDELLQLEYYLLPSSAKYEHNGGTWVDKSDDAEYIKSLFDDEHKLSVVGIIRPSEEATATSASGTVGYLPALMERLINENNDSEIVKAQIESPDTDIFTGIKFETEESDEPLTMSDIEAYISTLPAEEQASVSASVAQMKGAGMPDEKIIEMFSQALEAQSTDATYDGNLTLLGVSSLDVPSSILIYPKDFDSKELISDKIREYNASRDETSQINYTDYIGIMLSSVTTIINAISYVLIAFVAISLVVSSIMIGIITYISVLERTKEIGILRAVGASKRDVARVFNAETLIVGFTSGMIGIGVTLLLSIPINIIIENITDIANVAQLPFVGAVALVIISMLLTYIAGLIPARVAAKKDPVIALRSE